MVLVTRAAAFSWISSRRPESGENWLARVESPRSSSVIMNSTNIGSPPERWGGAPKDAP